MTFATVAPSPSSEFSTEATTIIEPRLRDRRSDAGLGRRLVGPAGAGANQVRDLNYGLSIAPAPTCVDVARVELVGTETQLDVLPVGLRLTAGAVGRDGQVEGQRGVRVIVQP